MAKRTYERKALWIWPQFWLRHPEGMHIVTSWHPGSIDAATTRNHSRKERTQQPSEFFFFFFFEQRLYIYGLCHTRLANFDMWHHVTITSVPPSPANFSIKVKSLASVSQTSEPAGCQPFTCDDASSSVSATLNIHVPTPLKANWKLNFTSSKLVINECRVLLKQFWQSFRAGNCVIV